MKKKSSLAVWLLVLVLLIVFLLACLPLPGTVPVLMYHFIGPKEIAETQKNFVTPEGFARQMAFLRFFGYRVIGPDDYYAIRSGAKDSLGREVLITFDDANYTFQEQALPVLQKYGFPVSVFAVSESVALGIHGSMNAAVLRHIAAHHPFVSIGSHSRTHPLLSQLSDGEIRAELEGSKSELETMLGRPVTDLAYPSSDIDERVIRIAGESGYRMAFATSYKKMKGLPESLYNIPRIKITKQDDCLFIFWAKVSGIYSTFKKKRAIAKGNETYPGSPI